MLIRFIREIFQVEDKKDVNFGYVAAGDGFSLALTLDREVLYSFGHASYGQLGIGVDKARSSDRYTTPQVVTFPKSVDIVSISAGDRHASALTSDHELKLKFKLKWCPSLWLCLRNNRFVGGWSTRDFNYFDFFHSLNE